VHTRTNHTPRRRSKQLDGRRQIGEQEAEIIAGCGASEDAGHEFDDDTFDVVLFCEVVEQVDRSGERVIANATEVGRWAGTPSRGGETGA
jgi:hypothetical protein